MRNWMDLNGDGEIDSIRNDVCRRNALHQQGRA